MGKIWDWIKGHPIIVIGTLGALLVFYVLYNAASNGTSNAASSVTGGQPSDAVVQAGAAVQIAQTQAQAASDSQNAQINGAITVAGINAQVANYQVEQQANVQSLGITTAGQVSQAGISSQQTIALAQAAEAAQIASISATVQNNIANDNAATDQARINAVTQISNAPYAVQIANINAGMETAKNLGSKDIASLINHATSTGGSINIGGVSAGGGSGASSSGNSLVAGIGAAIAAII